VSQGDEPSSEAAEPVERLRLLIAYNGAPFRGWQSQPTRDAVQDHLEAALSRIAKRPVTVHGSGRTDAGVHALGQVAHVDVPRGRISADRWMNAANAHLPDEIRVLKVTHAAPRFHARFDAEGKIYTYRIWHGPFLHPLEIGRAWHVPGRLDIAVLRAGAKLMLGSHDFAAFAARRGNADKNTTRTIHSIRILQRGSLITLRFEGNGFLYKMIRLITGSIVRCAQGGADEEWLRRFLTHPKAAKTKYLAPAEGLYLTRVLYGRPKQG
jgi:tRNA pseudouridine38-40 synthase